MSHDYYYFRTRSAVNKLKCIHFSVMHRERRVTGSHSMCHFHTQPVSYCKTIIIITHLHQSSMLKLALFPAFCWYCQWSKEGCHSTCVYTPYSITSKATTLPLADLVKKLTTHKAFPIVGNTPLRTPGDKLHTLNLGLFPSLPCFFVHRFCIQ